MTLTQFKHRFDAWRRERADIERLRRLDDYLLSDLGIERRDIRDYVRGRRSLEA